MNGTPTDLPAPDLSEPQPYNAGWRWRQMILLIILAFLAHLALVFSFGTSKPVMPQAVKKNVPQIQMASRSDELIELENPALFSLPNPRDFGAAVWLKTPDVTPPSFHWTEDPRWLTPPSKDFGAAFSRFMATNIFEALPLNFKPQPQFITPVSDIGSALPTGSSLQVSHGLAARQLLYQPPLPSLLMNDVIAPSRVRVLVDSMGNVISAILSTPDNSLETAGRSEAGDTNALILARSLRFKPAKDLTFGEITFNWHTIPMTSTNTP